jgi:regulator of protease activity HflC (stomatin/prohibitin superfamily)
VLVPTTNFVLHWITGKSETHRYDESLKSIDLVTKDAYEPLLPLSVVVHIDYERAPGVIQRFGDVKKLITQTLDPMLSAFFRDIAHTKTMLELLHERQMIQKEAREKLREKFHEFDIECVDVLIGKPDPREGDSKIETLLEQLRQRQLSTEQVETYDRQRIAAEKRRILLEAEANADMQTKLTNARVNVQVSESHGDAELALARKKAEQTVVVAEAELARSRREAEQTVLLAKASAEREQLAGRGKSQHIAQVGLAEASVMLRRIASYGDPRLYALSQVSKNLAHSKQPLVPERVFMAGSNGHNGDAAAETNGTIGLLGMLVSLLVAEKSGFQLGADTPELSDIRAFAERIAAEPSAQVTIPPATAIAGTKK